LRPARISFLTAPLPAKRLFEKQSITPDAVPQKKDRRGTMIQDHRTSKFMLFMLLF
jgi:hypothetical protein